MAKKEYEPKTEPLTIADVQESVSEAMALIDELKALVESMQRTSANPGVGHQQKKIDPLTERRIERLKDKLAESNRAIPELKKQGQDTEPLAKRLFPLAEMAIKLFGKLFSGGASP